MNQDKKIEVHMNQFTLGKIKILREVTGKSFSKLIDHAVSDLYDSTRVERQGFYDRRADQEPGISFVT